VVLKLDEEGALLEGPGQPRLHVPATRDPLIDATGAGDAFGGAFLAGWLAHGDAGRAARLAVQVGGWVVSRFGARPPADAALRERLERFSVSGVEA
ncbi:PfkB family carbohydrate kinase, partial [Deinococcus phoenicis]|uniref:PfkB family carbohydrate kinase n=1 Tax=Deinococcus phoenicis TaxID=1476583 RepID=UPI00055398D1